MYLYGKYVVVERNSVTAGHNTSPESDTTGTVSVRRFRSVPQKTEASGHYGSHCRVFFCEKAGTDEGGCRP